MCTVLCCDDDENREHFICSLISRARSVHTNFLLLHISNWNYWNFVNTCKMCTKFSVFDGRNTRVAHRHSCVSLNFFSFFFIFFFFLSRFCICHRIRLQTHLSNLCAHHSCVELEYVQLCIGAWSWTGWQINCDKQNRITVCTHCCCQSSRYSIVLAKYTNLLAAAALQTAHRK